MPPLALARFRSGRTTHGSEKPSVVIDWFTIDAQTINCNGDEIERWHMKKITPALSRFWPVVNAAGQR